MHTKEPWYADGSYIKSRVEDEFGFELVIIDCTGAMSGDDTPADKRRIVAAVNACAGITTPALEGGAIKEALEALWTARRQIQGLYAAYRSLIPQAQRDETPQDPNTSEIDAAITVAEGG